MMGNAAHAKSTTSMPRMIEPLDSLNVLPCSRVRICAKSSIFLSSNVLKRNKIFARWEAVVSHVASALLATETTHPRFLCRQH